jgi:hypothetical protein
MPATVAAAVAAAVATAAAMAAATAATSGDPDARFRGSRVFLVDDIERRQADVREFFFTEYDFVARRDLLQRQIRRRAAGRGRRNAYAAGEREQSGRSHNGHSLCPPL